MKYFPPELRRRLWMPGLATLALLVLLAINGILGTFVTHGLAWVPEGILSAVMIAIIVLFQMEAVRQPPVVRLFSGLGFFWVMVMFGLMSLDYMTR